MVLVRVQGPSPEIAGTGGGAADNNKATEWETILCSRAAMARELHRKSSGSEELTLSTIFRYVLITDVLLNTD